MKKLKNEQGVTILMALLLVLTAAVVSAVILSAALSAAQTQLISRSADALRPGLSSTPRLRSFCRSGSASSPPGSENAGSSPSFAPSTSKTRLRR